MDTHMHSECFPGTRVSFIQSIIKWSSNQSIQERIFWLYGNAGSGKSTLSATIANILHREERLGAFISFGRRIGERSVLFDRNVEDRAIEPSGVITTLAYQLGSYHPRIKDAIVDVIKANPGVALLPLQEQFSRLLLEPLNSLPATHTPIVLVLDAFEECGTPEQRAPLLELLAGSSANLPQFIRILITSRPEYDVQTALAANIHVQPEELDIESESNYQDILLYLRHRLDAVRSATSSLSRIPNWPENSMINLMADRTAGLFVWATTACPFIAARDAHERFHTVLQGGEDDRPYSTLDRLYTAVLGEAGDWDDAEFRSDFQVTIGTMLVAQNPMTSTALDELLSLDRSSQRIISQMKDAFHSEPILHIPTTFADYLSTRSRCGSSPWFIDRAKQNRRLASYCIMFLHKHLRKNVLNLTLSENPFTRGLPETLSYASTFWIDHLVLINEDVDEMADQLELLMFSHLLHWLEAMSLLKQSHTTIRLLQRLLNWSQVCASFSSR